jgi:hypothetical protein
MNLIAPCGMNCGICLAFLRVKNKCPGCANMGKKPGYCRKCGIRLCKKKSGFCFECKTFPCARLKHLDMRYRARYGMSLLENLGKIKIAGIRSFTKSEKLRWKCPKCKGVLCVHRYACLSCGWKRPGQGKIYIQKISRK